MRTHIVVLLFSPLLFLGSSCSKKNDADGIPSYLKIDKIELTTEFSTQGTKDHNIVDAWVFLNDNNIGCYELPATIPILAAGVSDIKIWPGVKNNGMINSRIRFPYYTKFAATPNLERGEVVELNPSVIYEAESDFWLEDFEDAGIKFEHTSGTQGNLASVSEEALVFEGYNSLHLALGENELELQCEMIDLIELPRLGARIFVEMNYKADNTFALGVIARTVTQISKDPVIVLNPTVRDETGPIWNKIYVEVTELVSSQTKALDYGIFFIVNKDAENTVANIYLDNIKIVY